MNINVLKNLVTKSWVAHLAKGMDRFDPFVIKQDGRPHVTRHWLCGFVPEYMRHLVDADAVSHNSESQWSIFHHQIHEPDCYRYMHNHRWDMVCKILTGGYTEMRTDMREHSRMYGPGDINVLPAHVFHRIVHVEPNTTTLAVTSREFQDWGYFVPSEDCRAKTEGAQDGYEALKQRIGELVDERNELRNRLWIQRLAT